jgi:hypothetical protein
MPMPAPMAVVFVDEGGGLEEAGLDWAGAGETLFVEVADAAIEMEVVEVVDVGCETLAAEPALMLKLPKPPDVDVLKSVMPQHPFGGAWPSWAPQQKSVVYNPGGLGHG